MRAFDIRRVAAFALCVALSGGLYAQAPGMSSAVVASDCDYGCLIGFVRTYMDALANKDPSRAHIAANVRFTENNVEMSLGHEGLWGTVTGVAPHGLEAADTTTGQGAWIGTVEEHGLPVYFGVRLRVVSGQIIEAETVVVRKTGLPLPFGDTSKLVHDPAFAQVLAPSERRPRERLLAVADSYFNTVELNDGVVFAPFDEDCARTENGLVTTKAGTGSSGDIAQGCEDQFKLGIYRINKRVRERRYPLVDEERGVVVATGFFDHANAFDTYRTTDGKERKTLLKWPNSISLIEAFKIRDGKIHRVETVFSYVPYFMHSPFARPNVDTAAVEHAEPRASAPPCDRTCLIGFADRYMEALVTQRPGDLPWANRVRYTENSVPMMVGEGLWGSARSKSTSPVHAVDPLSGNVVWYGLVNEHDAPAYLALRLHIDGGRISDVETVISRKFNPGPFADPAAFRNEPALEEVLPPAQRRPRERMQALVEGYFNTRQLNDGALFTQFDPACSRRENGLVVTDGRGASAVLSATVAAATRGCEAQLKLGLYRPLDRVRVRRFPVIDEERGIVVASALSDYSLRETRYLSTDGKPREVQDRYPSSRETLELFKIRDGKILRVEGVSVFQPYAMPSPWIR